MIHLVISGPPGSGKGTQAALIAEKYDWKHISTGAVLRDAIKKGTPLGKIAKQKIDYGNFVSDDIANRIIQEFLDENKDVNGFIFDGYPRTLSQAKIYEKMLASLNIKMGGFLLLNVEERLLTERLIARSKKSKRVDDGDLSIIQHRFEIYHKRTEPLKKYYFERDLLYNIDGNDSVDKVFDELYHNIDKIIV